MNAETAKTITRANSGDIANYIIAEINAQIKKACEIGYSGIISKGSYGLSCGDRFKIMEHFRNEGFWVTDNGEHFRINW